MITKPHDICESPRRTDHVVGRCEAQPFKFPCRLAVPAHAATPRVPSRSRRSADRWAPLIPTASGSPLAPSTWPHRRDGRSCSREEIKRRNGSSTRLSAATSRSRSLLRRDSPPRPRLVLAPPRGRRRRRRRRRRAVLRRNIYRAWASGGGVTYAGGEGGRRSCSCARPARRPMAAEICREEAAKSMPAAAAGATAIARRRRRVEGFRFAAGSLEPPQEDADAGVARCGKRQRVAGARAGAGAATAGPCRPSAGAGFGSRWWPRYGVTSVFGRRREMEDAVSIRPDFLRGSTSSGREDVPGPDA